MRIKWSIVWSDKRRCFDDSKIDDRAVTLLELHSHNVNSWKIASHHCHFPLILHFFPESKNSLIWWSNLVWHSQPGVKTIFFQSQLTGRAYKNYGNFQLKAWPVLHEWIIENEWMNEWTLSTVWPTDWKIPSVVHIKISSNVKPSLIDI